jgi:hypothetical protein
LTFINFTPIKLISKATIDTFETARVEEVIGDCQLKGAVVILKD